MSVSNSAVVVLVIIGAGFTLLVGAAIASFFVDDTSTEPNPFRERPIEQSMYMRNVRQRNLTWAWKEAKTVADRYLSPGRESSNSGQRKWAEQPVPGGGQSAYPLSEQTTPRG